MPSYYLLIHPVILIKGLIVGFLNVPVSEQSNFLNSSCVPPEQGSEQNQTEASWSFLSEVELAPTPPFKAVPSPSSSNTTLLDGTNAKDLGVHNLKPLHDPC